MIHRVQASLTAHVGRAPAEEQSGSGLQVDFAREKIIDNYGSRPRATGSSGYQTPRPSLPGGLGGRSCLGATL